MIVPIQWLQVCWAHHSKPCRNVEFQCDTWTTDGWCYKRRDNQLTFGLIGAVLVDGKAYKAIYTQSTLYYKKAFLSYHQETF